jgi:hypothetical protein
MSEQSQPDAHEALARDYLREQLGDRAPSSLTREAHCRERSLESEGAVTVFSFTLPPAGPQCGAEGVRPRRHYVVAGETEPTYFPAYGLNPDEAYSFHLGTRFMVTVGVGLVDASTDAEAPRDEAVRQVIHSVHPNAEIEELHLAAMFGVEDQRFAVYRVSVSGEAYYSVVGDCPPGFYRLTEYPPQVALRLHLGTLIRAEKRASDE